MASFVPVMVVNGWEWLEPAEFMEKLVEIFGKRKESTITTTPKERGQADTMGHELDV